ncbi:MAG TPA: hypothetical protein VIG93_09795 [Gaiellaceae bacterium]
MHRVRSRRRSYVAVVLVLLATTGAAVFGFTSVVSAGTAADTELKVTLGKPREYALKASATSGKAGEVAFVVRNRGKVTHEFIVLKTRTPATKLKPRPDEPGKVVEPGFLLEIEDVEPGHRVTVALPMKKGHYVLLCNIEDHYAGGMRSDLTLR